MRERKRMLVSAIYADPNDPRKDQDAASDRARADSMLAIGQQVPVLAYQDGDRTILIDGHGRWRSAKIAGIEWIDADIWPGRPNAEEILLAQLNIDLHRADLSAMDRSDAAHRAKESLGCSVNDLAAKLGISQAACSKCLALQRLVPEARKVLQEKVIDTERCI